MTDKNKEIFLDFSSVDIYQISKSLPSIVFKMSGTIQG